MSLSIYSKSHSDEILWVDSINVWTPVFEVFSVSADGEELKRALQITGLPQYGSSMKFYGDTAKHIIGNWFN